MTARLHKLSTKFHSKYEINPESGCWEWTGSRSHSGTGYGLMRWLDFKLESAHRISYSLHRGPIPEKAHVLHLCDNKKCVNPDHLYLGTHSDNIKDFHTKNPGILEKKSKVILTFSDLRSVDAVASKLGLKVTTVRRILLSSEHRETLLELERGFSRRNVAKLPQTLKTTYFMWAKGKKYEDIAKHLNIPIGTVRSRVHRAKKLLNPV